jgi:hypothetical protein
MLFHQPVRLTRLIIKGLSDGMTGDSSGLYGDCSGLYGDCSTLIGDCTGLWGNCTGVVGDLNLITKEEREIIDGLSWYVFEDEMKW